MIKPDIYNKFIIYKGVDFNQPLRISNTDLTGCELHCQLRTKNALDAPLIATFTITVNDHLTGDINLFLDKAVTSLITQKVGYYALTITNTVSGLDSVYIKGSMNIEPLPTVIPVPAP